MRAAKRRTDDLHEDTVAFLEDELERIEPIYKDRTKRVETWVKQHRGEDSLIDSALGVRSIGEMTVAYCIAYIDLDKQPTEGNHGSQHASCLWAYAGLDKPGHEGYTKGEAGGGKKALRCALWNMAESQVKGRGPYRAVYDNAKKRKANSEVIVKSRNTQGKWVECAWKDTKPSHRHGHALRIIMKHFLADYWFVGRTLRGLPTDPLYVEALLGHTHIIRPAERGWKLRYRK